MKRPQLQLTGYRTKNGEVHETTDIEKLRAKLGYKGKLTPQYARLRTRRK